MAMDSLTDHPVIKKANKAPSTLIQQCVPLKQSVKNITYRFHIRKPSELSDLQKSQIWKIFEANMKLMYEQSNVFPWDPPDKRKQMFNQHSRFLLITPDSDDEEVEIVAYSIFRFEKEDEKLVIYAYELQTEASARRLGLGEALVKNLELIGKAFDMSYIMLTHLKSNENAKKFYDSLGFVVDEGSPDFECDCVDCVDEDESGDKESKSELTDDWYSILVRSINSS